jgi:putative ABC transport system permease protein
MLNDLRFALRTLQRRRSFTAIAIATIALGIGAATSIYRVVDGVLFRPLPLRGPGRIAAHARDGHPYGARSHGELGR